MPAEHFCFQTLFGGCVVGLLRSGTVTPVELLGGFFFFNPIRAESSLPE